MTAIEIPERVLEAASRAMCWFADQEGADTWREWKEQAERGLRAALRLVGWWHWWDGDLSKSGQFRYDHPQHGVSVPVFTWVEP